MQPRNSRPSGEHGVPAGPGDEHGSFDPGPSFTDDPSDESAVGALPSWLQNFADVTSEAGDTAQGQSAPKAGEPPVVPDWSEAPRANAPAGRKAHLPPGGGSGQTSEAGDPGFFSENDLPEWLRALNTDEQAGESPVIAPAAVDHEVAPEAPAVAPVISRAWVTTADPPQPSPSSGLFASLAHELDTRPDTVGSEPTVMPTPAARAAARPAEIEKSHDEPPPTRRRWSRFRIWALAVLIPAVLFVYIILNRM